MLWVPEEAAAAEEAPREPWCPEIMLSEVEAEEQAQAPVEQVEQAPVGLVAAQQAHVMEAVELQQGVGRSVSC